MQVEESGPPGSPALVRASVDVAPPVKIRNVEPVYPELARRAGVEGIVIIECTIDPKGRIAGARVLRGHTLLDRAALDAVQQWVYRPTLLNDAPVSVIMTVTVNFRIAR
jgi:protein TonB